MKEYLICWSLFSIFNASAFYCYNKYYEIQSPNFYYYENRNFYKPLIDHEII